MSSCGLIAFELINPDGQNGITFVFDVESRAYLGAVPLNAISYVQRGHIKGVLNSSAIQTDIDLNQVLTQLEKEGTGIGSIIRSAAAGVKKTLAQVRS